MGEREIYEYETIVKSYSEIFNPNSSKTYCYIFRMP